MRYLAVLVVASALAACHAVSTEGIRNFPVERPVTFAPSAENGGKQCQPIYYGLGDGDGIRDVRCFDLQVRLSEAAYAGDITTVRSLLADGANANSQAGDHYHPLDAAAANGQTEAAKILLDNGANVNYWHPIHGFPLGHAAYKGNSETVELLLSRGADVNLESDGYTALRTAREGQHPEIVALLERAGAR
ncbi:MAG: ankyrin repeat domain-containing protein [Pyrinomonadaceae bacterium]|nr:ankyrin repeat domain-containing protein [Pyrinomonadaceae bacterium]MBP6212284.1 ankyrin repeat domain-containing protein [Pyrinomonadaceae bacterium]